MLTTLSVKDFRSYDSATFSIKPLVIITGRNGSGKTTLIEAIRVLSVGKSFRSNRLDEVIRFNQPYLQVTANWNDAELDFFYGTQFTENPIKERRLQVNKKEDQYIDYIGRFPSVLFIPEHLEIILGAPSERRRYFDSVLWQVDREFRQAHLDLQRVLKERSALLFLIKTKRAKIDELEPWSELLREKTAIVRSGRQRFSEYISQKMGTDLLYREDLTVTVVSKPAFTETEDLIFQEIESAQNLFGAHRDEIEIVFQDRPARKFASRGQSRTIIAAIKVIEAQFLKENTNIKPVILLDDILSELDQTNTEFVLNNFSKDFQVIATSVEQSKEFSNYEVVAVQNDA